MALKDRFHQMRGDVFNNMASLAPGAGSRGAQVTMADVRGDTARSAVNALLQDRGVPITAENQQAALTYLLGGKLEGLSSQSTTEQDIASQALQESGDVPSAAPSTSSPPSSAPASEPATIPASLPPSIPDSAPTIPASPDGAPDVTQTAPTQPNAPQQEVDPMFKRPGDTGTPATPASPNQGLPTQDGQPVTEQDTASPGPGRSYIPEALLAAGITADMIMRWQAAARQGDQRAADQLARAGLNGEIVYEVPATRAGTNVAGNVPGVTVPDSDVSVTMNPPRTDNALPAPPESAAIDDPFGSQPAIERGAPNVGQAQVVTTQEMMNAGVDPNAGQDMGDGLVAHRGTDGNVYISDSLTGNNARLTADEAHAMTTQPGWRSIILKTLRGR